MDNKHCPKCGASWLGGQMFWGTGKPGSEADLAGLVCDVNGDETCVNELKGTDHDGMTWEKRMAEVDRVLIDQDKADLERRFKL